MKSDELVWMNMWDKGTVKMTGQVKEEKKQVLLPSALYPPPPPLPSPDHIMQIIP